MQIGRYAIEGELGAGLMRARDATLGRDVAIQLLPGELDRERVLREAQAMASLTHPNVVKVHELGEASGAVYVAMELVGGARLPAWLAAAPRSARNRAAVAVGVGRGLAAAHAAGVVHGAVGPECVVVRDDGVAVVVDFALARRAGEAREALDQERWWAMVAVLVGARVARLGARGFPSMTAAVAALDDRLAPRGGRRAVLALGAAALAAGSGYVMWPRSEATSAHCVPVPPPEWQPARSAQLAGKLRDAGIEPARVIAAIDARAATTAELRARVCRDPAASARLAVCVDEIWGKTAVALGRLDDRTQPAQLRETIDGLTELMPAERCARGSLPAIPATRSSEDRAIYDALAKRFRDIERDSGAAPADRLARLRGMASELEPVHDPRLEAGWHYAMAHALADARDYPAAVGEFDRSAHAALAAADDARFVRALTMALQIVPPSAPVATTVRFEAEATAAAQRLGNPFVDAELLRARAYVHRVRGNHEAARALFEQADAIYREISLGPHPMHVHLLQNLAGVCLDLGDGEAAERTYDRTVELARARFGEASPSYWEARAARASSFVGRKQYARAEVELRAAADGFAKFVPAAGELGMVQTYLCETLVEEARLADARATCAAARADLEARLGPDSPGLVTALAMSGRVEHRDHQPERAVAFLRRAVELARSGQLRPIEAASAKVYLALALHDAGQLAEARALAVEVAPAFADRGLEAVRAEYERAFPEVLLHDERRR